MKTAAGTVRWEYAAGPLRYGAEYKPGPRLMSRDL
jgi:hypothetical protein